MLLITCLFFDFKYFSKQCLHLGCSYLRCNRTNPEHQDLPVSAHQLRISETTLDQLRIAQTSIAWLHIALERLAQTSLDQPSCKQPCISRILNAQTSLDQPSWQQPAHQEFWVSAHQPRLAQTSLAQLPIACGSRILGVSSLAQTRLDQPSLAANSLRIMNSGCQLTSLDQRRLAQPICQQLADQEFWVSAHQPRLTQTSLAQLPIACGPGIQGVSSLAQTSLDQPSLAANSLRTRNSGCQLTSLDQPRLAQPSCQQPCVSRILGVNSLPETSLDQRSLAANSPVYHEFSVSAHQHRLAQTSLAQLPIA